MKLLFAASARKRKKKAEVAKRNGFQTIVSLPAMKVEKT
jgi:hypothetical protein